MADVTVLIIHVCRIMQILPLKRQGFLLCQLLLVLIQYNSRQERPERQRNDGLFKQSLIKCRTIFFIRLNSLLIFFLMFGYLVNFYH